MGSYFTISASAIENSYDIENNVSNVTVTLYCNGSNGFADDNPAYWLKIDGVIVSSGTRNFNYENFVLATWTGNITHREDGTGSFTYQGYFQGTDKPDGDTTPIHTLQLTPFPNPTPEPEPEPEPTVTSPAGLVIPFDIDFNRIINFLVPEPDILYFSL